MGLYVEDRESIPHDLRCRPKERERDREIREKSEQRGGGGGGGVKGPVTVWDSVD